MQRKILGGTVPGGRECSEELDVAVSCETAASILAARMEEDPDAAETGRRLRLHMFGVVDRDGDAALGPDTDGFGHFLGGDAAIASECTGAE